MVCQLLSGPSEPAATSVPGGPLSARGEGKKEMRLFCMPTGGLASLFAHVYGDYRGYLVYQECMLAVNM